MAATAGSKTLAAWREGVAHGTFFQPIRLTVQNSTPAAAARTAPAVSRAPEPAESAEPSADTTGVEAKEATAAARCGESVVVIPPFTSVEVPGEQHNVALNVGGPVWAMDWLPEQSVAADTAASGDAGGKGKTKQKRAKKPQAKTKGKAAEAEQTGKENAVENDANSQVTEQETPDCSEDTNWRFLALSTHPPCDVRDGKVVRATPPDHYYDAQEAAPSLIQIWAVPVPPRAGRKRALPTPRFVYGIEHSSGIAWKMQWSTLVSEMPQEIKAREPLGVLAVAFGDGSLRVFAVPQIPPERLLADKIAPDPTLIEILRPLVIAKSSRIISLCLQWSPRRWNLILSGCSDGSVELWNIESAIGNARAAEESELEPLEPQRCFQDADTVGKQDAFDWGNGWAAVRAICWSPFDEFIFATTGNDSLFKVWDVREPRICLRSHRIRSTWGNSIQWLADTSILISGDQGSVYLYDIVSGSYQKLHFHPQVDSPIWDIQLARHEPIPLMISGCASGSIRIAPARKLYRNPHNSVEVCRISGRKDANVHDEYKELRVSFERSTIMGTAENSGPAIREFCERDAALHCLRLTTFKPRQFPCLLAAAGHAGLLVIMELQDMLDSFLASHFQPSAKKMGRPKAIPMGGHGSGQKKKAFSNGQPKGRRGITLGKFVDVKSDLSLPKAKAKKRKPVVTTVEYVGVVSRTESVVDDQEEEVEEEEEAEFDHDAEESESDGSINLEDDDNSDDERISISDDDEEASPSAQPQLNAEEMRMMSEYQLDLSEEDAILLAIQMSEADRDHPIDLTRLRDDMDVSKPATATKGKSKKASTSKSTKNLAATDATGSSDVTREQAVAGSSSSVEPVIKPEPVPDTPVEAVTAAASKRKLPSKKQATKQRAVAVPKDKKVAAPAAVIAAMAEPMVDQATVFQMIAYQRGLNEEEALLEAIRLSEIESKQPPSRSKRSASDVDKLGQDATTTTTKSSPKRRRKGIVPAKTALDAPPALAADETARFGQEREVSASEEAVNNSHSHATTSTETEVEASDARDISATETESTDDAKTLACPVAVAKEASSPPEAVDAKQASTPPSETIDDAQSAQLSVADHPREEDLEADQPAAKSSRRKAAAKSKAKAPAAKRKKSGGRPPKAPGKAAGKAPSKRRRSGSDAMLQGAHGEFLSEEEALFMALQTSEIEF